MFFHCKAPATKGNTYYIYRGVVRQLAEREEHLTCLFVFRSKLKTFKIEVF